MSGKPPKVTLTQHSGTKAPGMGTHRASLERVLEIPHRGVTTGTLVITDSQIALYSLLSPWKNALPPTKPPSAATGLPPAPGAAQRSKHPVTLTLFQHIYLISLSRNVFGLV